jgi:hypothetical protein
MINNKYKVINGKVAHSRKEKENVHVCGDMLRKYTWRLLDTFWLVPVAGVGDPLEIGVFVGNAYRLKETFWEKTK